MSSGEEPWSWPTQTNYYWKVLVPEKYFQNKKLKKSLEFMPCKRLTYIQPQNELLVSPNSKDHPLHCMTLFIKLHQSITA